MRWIYANIFDLFYQTLERCEVILTGKALLMFMVFSLWLDGYAAMIVKVKERDAYAIVSIFSSER